MILKSNHAKLLAYMEKESIDGFFITNKPNVRYISSYTGDDSYLLITRTSNYFISDSRYTEQAEMECPDYTIVNWREPHGRTIGEVAAALAEKAGLKSVAFESDSITHDTYDDLKKHFKADLLPAKGVIEKLRSVKGDEEIHCLKAACDISCRALERLLKDIRVGVTEKELAAKLSLYMVMEGSDTMPYGNILISGARTSLLHGIPSEKAVEYGDLVLMDFGCQYHGYMSDMTRTVIVGKPTAKQREVYNLERRMVEDSLAVMKAGVKGTEVYEASLKAIKDTEYLDYHYSGIGHGIGLFVHEPPSMGKDSKDVLTEGNVLTIEPGIYIPGWGGVRIEDQVLITKDGYENMVSATHELIEL